MFNSHLFSRFLGAAFVATAGFVAFAGAVIAEEAEKRSEAKPGVISLFDGKTLGSWEVVQSGGEGKVTVEEGELVIGRGDPITSIVWKGEKLPRNNYELSWKAKKVDGTDFFSTVTFPVQDAYCSLVLGGWGGGVVGLSSLNGADASENPTTLYQSFEKGRWYDVRLRVTDSHVKVWLDGKEIINAPTEEYKFSIRIEMTLTKPLGISSFVTVGSIKDIQIQDLTKTEKLQEKE
ncbi:3-keto-disaccharide hydrolase [Planctomicrobium sp. SH668]|uniref:3-keto-disaccharide hydrolase n=1 Tax=Planctomicrobium sp. SH668 TaxID=3448126 RepID=UPI003F5C97DD